MHADGTCGQEGGLRGGEGGAQASPSEQDPSRRTVGGGLPRCGPARGAALRVLFTGVTAGFRGTFLRSRASAAIRRVHGMGVTGGHFGAGAPESVVVVDV